MRAFATLLLLLAPITQARTVLSDAEVQAAITAGTTNKFKDLVSDCVATSGFGEGLFAKGLQYNGGFTVTASGAKGRIAFLAAAAKKLYKPFAAADVPESTRVHQLFLHVEPNKPLHQTDTISVAAPIDAVVLKSKSDPSRVLQPTSFVTETVEWSNLMGGKVAGNRASTTFSLDEFRALPPGEVDIVVITNPGERRCKIGKDDRTKVSR